MKELDPSRACSVALAKHRFPPFSKPRGPKEPNAPSPGDCFPCNDPAVL